MQSNSSTLDHPQTPEAAFAEYRRSRSPEAFELLMRHYVDLVYASALRQLRDGSRAEDATQVVFTVLALKAHKLREDTVLPAWLLKVTRYTVLDARRRQQRRQRHELIAQQIRDEQGKLAMNTAGPIGSEISGGVADEGLRAVLDEGIAKLNQSERSAVVLRFFEGKSHGDIAAALGIREEAARKRVQRGIEKLRAFFAARGAIASTAPAALLETALATHARVPAPASLMSSLASHAPSVICGAAPSSLTSCAKGVITLMAWTKVKVAFVAALVLLLAGGGAVAVHAVARHHDEIVTLHAGTDSGSPSATSQVRIVTADDSASDYSLAPGQVLKLIPRPSPAARARLSSFGADRNPTSVTVEWDGNPHLQSQTYGGRGQSLEGMLIYVVGLSSFEFELPRGIANGNVPGDWIVRKGATPDQLMPALEAILRAHGRNVRFEKRRVKQDVIVARGAFQFQPNDDPNWKRGVNLYSDKLNEPGLGGGATGNLDRFLTDLGSMLRRRVINQAEPHSGGFQWSYHKSGDLRYARPGPDTEKKLDQVLANVARQTGLTFQKTTADEDVWFVTRTAPGNP